MPLLPLHSSESSTHEEIQRADFKPCTSGYGEYLQLHFREVGFADTAMKQYNRIAEAIESLSIYPERFQVMDIVPKLPKDVRQVIADHYSAIYTIEEDTVTVIRVLYSASITRITIRTYGGKK